MKTILVILIWTAASIAQASEWTALVATEGAMVTIEASIAPTPVPDSTPTGSRANQGKITLDIDVPAEVTCPSDGTCPLRCKASTPPVGSPRNPSRTGGDCPGGACAVLPTTKEEMTPRTVIGRWNRAAYSLSATTRTRWQLFRR